MAAKKQLWLTDADMAKDATPTTERVWFPVSKIPDHIWSENPKQHDIGSLIQLIQDVGFKDAPRWNAYLPNTSGGAGAFIYGNGRASALYAMWSDGGYDVPHNIIATDDEWYMPLDTGLDEELTLARAWGIDHNLATVSGGDVGIKELMSIFDQQRLADTWSMVANDNRQLVTLDGEDLAGLFKYLEEPMFDTGNAPVNVGDSAAHTGDIEDVAELPPSAIRQVQLFYDTDTIEQFSALANECRELSGTQSLSDTVLWAMQQAVQGG